jgi:hypothetical protein
MRKIQELIPDFLRRLQNPETTKLESEMSENSLVCHYKWGVTLYLKLLQVGAEVDA